MHSWPEGTHILDPSSARQSSNPQRFYGTAVSPWGWSIILFHTLTMLGKWHDMTKWPLRNLVELWGTIIDQCLQFVYPFAIWVIARVETCLYNSASRMTPPSSSGLECEPWAMGIDQLSWLSLLKISPRQMAAQVSGYINIFVIQHTRYILSTSINIDILVSLYLVIHPYFGISIDTSTYFNILRLWNPAQPPNPNHRLTCPAGKPCLGPGNPE